MLENTRWNVWPDARQLAANVARKILALAEIAIADRGVFKIVLAGGGTPAAVYRLLRETDTDWTAWQIYFGDERCLPVDDPERNSAMAGRYWLDHVAVPASNIHPIPAELGAEQAARRYSGTVGQALPFDLVLLGVGEDGHTASLFPGQVHDPGALVHAVHDAPKPPAARVSLGLAALNDARDIIFLVSGAGKHDAVQRWRRGEPLPVSGIHGVSGVDIWLDEDAAVGNSV